MALPFSSQNPARMEPTLGDNSPPSWNREQKACGRCKPACTTVLERIYPREEVIQGSRRNISCDQSDLNIRVAPDYFFAKDVPGPGIAATGAHLLWVPRKSPSLDLEMASPSRARTDRLEGGDYQPVPLHRGRAATSGPTAKPQE